MARLREAKERDIGRRIQGCRQLHQLKILGEVVRLHYASTAADRQRNARGLAKLQVVYDTTRADLTSSSR